MTLRIVRNLWIILCGTNAKCRCCSPVAIFGKLLEVVRGQLGQWRNIQTIEDCGLIGVKSTNSLFQFRRCGHRRNCQQGEEGPPQPRSLHSEEREELTSIKRCKKRVFGSPARPRWIETKDAGRKGGDCEMSQVAHWTRGAKTGSRGRWVSRRDKQSGLERPSPEP